VVQPGYQGHFETTKRTQILVYGGMRWEILM